VVEIYLPPLRDRAGDIKLLANEFLGRFAQSNGKKITGFDERAWEWILSYQWPGNVRELKNAVERAVIMARGERISADDVMPRHARLGGDTPAPLTVPAGSTLAETRRQLVLRTFASTSGDVGRTAKIVGISPEEVQQEIASLLRANGSAHGAEALETPALGAPARQRPAAPKAKARKR
jgi:DNA-binding NtrC family response regulator